MELTRALVRFLGMFWAAGLLGFGHDARAAQKLNVFIWSEYLDPAVVKEFEKRHDAEVTLDYYEEAESMIAKMQGGGAGVYDIVVPPDHAVTSLVQLGLLSPLRHERIPNLKHIDARFRRLPFDPRNEHTVPYQWGTLGIYYRKAAGRPAPDSWDVFFDKSKQRGPMVMIDSMRDAIGAALKYRGHSFNATELPALKQAREALLDTKKRCLAFEGSVAGKNRVVDRTADLAVVFSGEAVRGMAEDEGTGYVIPKEGSEIFLDNLAVPARAPHRDLAEDFINFVLEPRIGARLVNHTRFGTPNAAAREFVNSRDLANPAIYPSPEVMAKLEYLVDLGSRTAWVDQVWTQVKAE
ncbi:MAG: spermidine/putrescine ABC transporter substrate-binding protein [Limisphaerales bacterium]